MKIKDLVVERHKLEAGRELIWGGDGLEAVAHALVHSERHGGVFTDPAYDGTIYTRNNRQVASFNEDVDLLVASCPTSDKDVVFETVTPRLHTIGWGHHRRDVWELLGGSGPSLRLRCGETRNVKGGWSSWPPHSFDFDPSKHAEFEEVFVAFTRPAGSFGAIRRKGVFTDGREVDDMLLIRTGDMFEVPLGFHPIVAGPETDIMYVWFYLSPEPKVYARWAEDVGCYK